MNLQILCALTLLVTLTCASARAEEPAPKKPAPAPAKPEKTARDQDARSADATTYKFEDDLVQGDTLAPSLEVLTVRSHKDRQSLIRARESFVVELLKSTQAL